LAVTTRNRTVLTQRRSVAEPRCYTSIEKILLVIKGLAGPDRVAGEEDDTWGLDVRKWLMDRFE
jgi:hypothetical protein